MECGAGAEEAEASQAMMTPADFEKWMERQGLNTQLAAEYLGIGRKSVERYGDGTSEIPISVELACAALEPLRLYRLTPVDIGHNDWRASTHKEPVTVRAQTEQLARWHAAKAYHFAARRRAGDLASPENPWLSPRRSTIEEIEPTEALPLAGQPGLADC